MRTLVITTLAVLGLACSKSGEFDKAAGGSAGARDAVVAAWKDAKLTPSALTPATVRAARSKGSTSCCVTSGRPPRPRRPKIRH